MPALLQPRIVVERFVELGMQFIVPLFMGDPRLFTLCQCGTLQPTPDVSDAVFGPFRERAEPFGGAVHLYEYTAPTTDGRAVRCTVSIGVRDMGLVGYLISEWGSAELPVSLLQDGQVFEAATRIDPRHDYPHFDAGSIGADIRARLRALNGV